MHASDLERKQNIQTAGYRVIEQWECFWNQQKGVGSEVKHFVNFDRLPQAFTLTNSFKAVLIGEIYGNAEVDILVPDILKQLITKVPPIFKNIKVERPHLFAEMQEYAKEIGLMRNG